MNKLYYGVVIVIILIVIGVYYFTPTVLSVMTKTDSSWSGSGPTTNGRTANVLITFSNISRILRTVSAKIDISFSDGNDIVFNNKSLSWSNTSKGVYLPVDDMMLSIKDNTPVVLFKWLSQPIILSKRKLTSFVMPHVFHVLLTKPLWVGEAIEKTTSNLVKISLIIEDFIQITDNSGSVSITIEKKIPSKNDNLSVSIKAAAWTSLFAGSITFVGLPGTSILSKPTGLYLHQEWMREDAKLI